MNIKENDLVVISSVGINFLVKNHSNFKKIKSKRLFRVTKVVDSENFYIETLDGGQINTMLPISYYQLATASEIKKYTIKNIFSK